MANQGQRTWLSQVHKMGVDMNYNTEDIIMLLCISYLCTMDTQDCNRCKQADQATPRLHERLVFVNKLANMGRSFLKVAVEENLNLVSIDSSSQYRAVGVTQTSFLPGTTITHKTGQPIAAIITFLGRAYLTQNMKRLHSLAKLTHLLTKEDFEVRRNLKMRSQLHHTDNNICSTCSDFIDKQMKTSLV
ncbi:hypothetical protein T4B_4914 [Trichinella pseudospiralis]|uniref:Uncharacterized protein n=1 Tax=Trichinella pseudospiralis TaxID=6337 RepID=A0A0V1IV37_TRIPS|nr:hypothetical protein T4B_4914 [Trichinella pseudospiralis]